MEEEEEEKQSKEIHRTTSQTIRNLPDKRLSGIQGGARDRRLNTHTHISALALTLATTTKRVPVRCHCRKRELFPIGFVQTSSFLFALFYRPPGRYGSQAQGCCIGL